MLDELIRRPSRNRLAVVAGAGVFLYRGVVVQQVPGVAGAGPRAYALMGAPLARLAALSPRVPARDHTH